jgi:putative transcriptional regulator
MNKNNVAKRLKTLRGKKPRKEVADRIGVSISALQMYENGKRVPKDEIKVALAKYYGIPVQDIFFEN